MSKAINPFETIGYNSISAKILISVGKVGDLSRVYVKNKNSVRRSLCNLIQKKMIKKNKKGGLYLTEYGIIEFFKLELSQVDLLPVNKVCMVVFDVPEISKHWRNTLRKFLKGTCFFPLQKSVWISPFDAADKLMEILRFLKLENLVKIYIAEEIETR
jgi:CRISPR-associated endonuclease Cas2